MTINTYDKGDTVNLRGILRDAAGAAIDPSDVTVKYKKPGAAIVSLVYLTDAALIREEEGTYSANVLADTSGAWRYRIESTGTIKAAAEGQFRVRNSAFD